MKPLKKSTEEEYRAKTMAAVPFMANTFPPIKNAKKKKKARSAGAD